MAAVEVTISGILYDKLNRTVQQVALIGEASLTGLSVGGGPIMPPPGGGGQPPTIWPGPGPLPGIEHPIALPGDPWWPKPPGFTPPAPGSPPVLIPGGTPVHPIVAPPFIVVHYPGMGPVVVPQPLPPDSTPPSTKK